MKLKNIILLISFNLIIVNLSPAQEILRFTDGVSVNDYGSRTLVREFNSNSSFNKLSFYLKVKHSWVNDLEVSITNPAGVKATIIKRLGTADCFGCDGDDLDVLFTDNALIDYDSLNRSCANEPAYGGDAQAMESLDLLLETDASGSWTFELIDHFPHESGNIELAELQFSTYAAPECTLDFLPGDGEDKVAVNTILSWEQVENATGYYLNLGYESNNYTLMDKVDVGNVLEYDPGLLDCGSIYYMQVLPYNEYGEAAGCVEHSFSTEYVDVLIAEDAEICSGTAVDLIVSSGYYNYMWLPQIFLSDPSVSNPVFSGDSSVNYTIIVSNENGCMDTVSLSVTVNSIDLVIDSVDHVRLNSLGFIEISMDDPDGEYLFDWSGPNDFYSSDEDLDSLEVGCYKLSVLDLQTGCTLDTTICVDDLTGVGREFSKTAFKVYPNPFKDEIIVYQESTTHTKDFLVSLFDVYGREIELNNWISKESKMHISSSVLPEGTYVVKIRSEINSIPVFFQVVKQK